MSIADTAETTTADLVAQARRGDRRAFGELVRRYTDMAFATAYGVLSDRHTAEDTVQDAFVAAFEALGGLRRDESFGPWLRGVVHRRAIDLLRRRCRTPFVPNLPGGILPGIEAQSARNSVRTGDARDLWDAVDTLPPRQREAVLVTYLDGLTYERAAHYLGIPVSTLKGRLNQARKRLRVALDGDDADTTRMLAMNREQIEQKVENSIACIATEEIDERIALPEGVRNVVFYSSVPCSLEICQTDGTDVLVTGTKSTIGPDEGTRRHVLDGIGVHSDRVDDYYTSGPNEGVECLGNRRDDEGNIIASTISTKEAWTRFGQSALKRRNPFDSNVHFPEIAPWDVGIFDVLIPGLRNVQRITLTQPEVKWMTLPREQLTPDMRRGFSLSYGDDKEVHGELGSAHVVLAVPKGTLLTVAGMVNLREARVTSMTGDLHFILCNAVELENVEGTVRLLNTHVKRAARINGGIVQSHYRINQGVNWRVDNRPRAERHGGDRTSEIEQVTGDVVLDVLDDDLELSDINGSVRTRNRWGTTRLHVSESNGSRYRIESDSGEVKVFVHDEIADDINFTLNSICGVFEYGPFNQIDVRNGAHNCWSDMSLSTVPGETQFIHRGQTDYAADIVVTTRDGNIIMEKTK